MHSLYRVHLVVILVWSCIVVAAIDVAPWAAERGLLIQTRFLWLAIPVLAGIVLVMAAWLREQLTLLT
jgi:hypothetical protein